MAKDRESHSSERIETSIIPLRYVDTIEDVFHALLALALLINEMGLNALIVIALVFAIFMSKMAHRQKV
jgi:hypothetical protein